jgi:hypothetical protein
LDAVKKNKNHAVKKKQKPRLVGLEPTTQLKKKQKPRLVGLEPTIV